MINKIEGFQTSDGEIHATETDAKWHETDTLFKKYIESDYSPFLADDGSRISSKLIMAWLIENHEIVVAFLDIDPDPIIKEMVLIDKMIADESNLKLIPTN
jgi:hypothetical protein